jgi:pyruvate/2-oxoglutarate/acetoin dehydrogenase E1 component
MLALEFEFSSNMSVYFGELSRSMSFLADQHDTLFLGQAVAVPGTAMRNTLECVQEEKLLELPVEEDFQLGLAVGLSLNGITPICVFPRWNFLLLATNQLVNHLDKLKELTQSSNPGRVIIRTGIGSQKPLHPGPQHVGDFTEAFRLMCININIVRLDSPDMIYSEYKKAYEREDGTSSLLIEWSDRYHE